MRRVRSHEQILAGVLMALSAFLPIYPAYAVGSVSASYSTNDSVMNNFGGSATSGSFSSVQSGGQSVAGESTSTNFTMSMGYAYFDSFAPESGDWQWFDDETNETPTAPLAGENVAPSAMDEQNISKLRVSVHEMAGIGENGAKFRLQFSTSSDFSSGATFLSEQSQCSGSSEWCYANGGGVDNAVISTTLLSDPDPCTAGVGDGCGTHNEYGTSTSLFTHKKSATTEYEFTITQSGALINTVYFFRLFDVAASSSVPLHASSTYPSLSTGGSALTFTIGGLDAGTTTEGQLTGVTTTPTSIPFGTLPFGTPTAAAQRLSVSTNATQGYQIFAFENQGLVDSTGAEIPPVSGTNSSPSGWSSGCASGAPGCYGYHSGEDVLSGGSTRFAANDTFAQFSTTPQEIAYSATPTPGKDTDIVMRVEARTGQDAGSYQSGITYIIVPVF